MDWRILNDPQRFTPMCRRCTWCGPLKDAVLTESGPHIKATCPECGTYLCFAGKRKDAIASTNGPRNTRWVVTRAKANW